MGGLTPKVEQPIYSCCGVPTAGSILTLRTVKNYFDVNSELFHQRWSSESRGG